MATDYVALTQSVDAFTIIIAIILTIAIGVFIFLWWKNSHHEVKVGQPSQLKKSVSSKPRVKLVFDPTHILGQRGVPWTGYMEEGKETRQNQSNPAFLDKPLMIMQGRKDPYIPQTFQVVDTDEDQAWVKHGPITIESLLGLEITYLTRMDAGGMVYPWSGSDYKDLLSIDRQQQFARARADQDEFLRRKTVREQSRSTVGQSAPQNQER